VGSNIDKFLVDLKAFGGTVDSEVRDVHRALHLEGVKRIVFRTPVKTGRARSSVQSTLHSAPDVEEKRKPFKSGRPALTQANRIAAKIKPYTASFITMNVPYGPKLENGSSKQAPRGMFNITAQELKEAKPTTRRV